MTKKRALIMSGGGVKGAFQLGVLSRLILDKGLDWSYIAGVSVGALNASVLGQGPIETQYKLLNKFWVESVKNNSSIWVNWRIFRLIAGLWKPSFYNSSPLVNLIKNYVSDSAMKAGGREMRFGAVAYGTGEYREADQNTPNLAAWVAASAAFPPFLLPQKINKDWWMDGGVRCVTPLQGAIDAGIDDIDVILCSPRKTSPASITTTPSAISIAMRAIELQGDELFNRDLKIAELYNKLVTSGSAVGKRLININIYEPKEPLLSGEFSSLQFNHRKILEMIEIGKAAVSI